VQIRGLAKQHQKLNPLEDQRGIDSTERKVIRHEIFDFTVTSCADHIIQISATLVDIHEIRRRSEPLVLHHFDSKPCLNAATCSQRMSEVTLQCVNRYVFP